MLRRIVKRSVFSTTVILCGLGCASGQDAVPISPSSGMIRLFNGKNLDGLYTWLNDTRYEDPRKVFTVEDGMIHISGDGGHVIYCVNGIQSNEGFDAQPASGKILIQSEGAEVYVRRFELHPLGRQDASAHGTTSSGIMNTPSRMEGL